MRPKKYCLCLIFLIFTAPVSNAAIYMQKDADGNITYSDTPSTNAQMVDLPTVNTSPTKQPPPTTTPTKNKNTAANTEKKPYTAFAITSPKDQETIQNQPTISVTIKIEPALQPGDNIALFLDGHLIGSPEPNTQLQLTQINRGTHQLFAVLMDENKQVLKESNKIVINVHQNSSVTSPAMQSPRPPTS